MEDIVRGTLAGIVIGGFAVSLFEANRITVQALWRVNCLAAEIAWIILKAPLEQIMREEQRRVEAEYDAAEDTDDEDED